MLKIFDTFSGAVLQLVFDTGATKQRQISLKLLIGHAQYIVYFVLVRLTLREHKCAQAVGRELVKVVNGFGFEFESLTEHVDNGTVRPLREDVHPISVLVAHNDAHCFALTRELDLAQNFVVFVDTIYFYADIVRVALFEMAEANVTAHLNEAHLVEALTGEHNLIMIVELLLLCLFFNMLDGCGFFVVDVNAAASRYK